MLIIPIVLALAFTAFALRLWWIQVAQYEEFKERATSMGRLENHTLAPRGQIIDRDGIVIADVRPQIVVLAEPGKVLDKPEILNKLASVLQTDVSKFERVLKNNRHRGNFPIPIYFGASVQKAAIITEELRDLEGVSVEIQPMRVYNESIATSKIIGWVSIPSAEIAKQLEEQGITPAEYVGRDGLERHYEELLMGVPGKQTIAVDRRGRPTRTISDEMPIPGSSLFLSLDLRAQEIAVNALGDHKGAVVALDPRNGEVICLASTPTFDSTLFDNGLTTTEFDALFKDPRKPMFKRAIAGGYPPGSTFKIVTSIGAALAGRFHPSDRVYCPGYITVGRKRVRCENHAAGSMDFFWAFTKSCNSYFGKLAQKEGADAVRNGARQAGLGQLSGIDIPGEDAGKVPNDEWVEENYDRNWSLGDTNNIGIGQGDLLVTPLQMANVAALVANRGTSYKPHLVRAIQSPGPDGLMRKVEPEVLSHVDLSDQFWDTMQSAMESVVRQGTARRVQIPGITVAGKTGSAENPFSRRTHAWFVGYAPAENPKIAFAVIVEVAGHGGSVAAPIAKQIIEEFLREGPRKPIED